MFLSVCRRPSTAIGLVEQSSDWPWSVGDEDRQKQYVAEIRQKIISTHVIHVTKNSIRQRTQRMQRAVWAH